tara:strand:- start:701 stop:862 length:162 start_codon:yes stop_codon:yes gene_type:complete
VDGLLSRSSSLFEDQGIDHITLNYVVGNPQAERFWKKLGFNLVVVAANRSPKT